MRFVIFPVSYLSALKGLRNDCVRGEESLDKWLLSIWLLPQFWQWMLLITDLIYHADLARAINCSHCVG
jgi:hypothetical protein